MVQQDPTKYTDVSQEDWDRFKVAAKAKGMNISGNEDDVEFDKIAVHMKYTPEQKTLQFTCHTPHWLADGVTTGALHTILAGAMNVPEVPKANENPVVTKEPSAQQQKNDDAKAAGAHPANVSRTATGPQAAAKATHSR
jgi:hypothetical protein